MGSGLPEIVKSVHAVWVVVAVRCTPDLDGRSLGGQAADPQLPEAASMFARTP